MKTLTVCACVPLALAVLAVGGCATGGDPSFATSIAPQAVEVPEAPALSGALTVFAAASLTEAFTKLGDRFMAANPQVTVSFNFGGSSSLAAQINSGAPADVFAAANPETMQTVLDLADNENDPQTFSRNTLQIAVPAGNPGSVQGLADFARPELAIALCAAEVPCGAATRKVFAAAGVTPSPDTLELSVKAALSKVLLGEVDAALVYETDVKAAAGLVEGIEFQEASTAVNIYPIVALADAPHSEAAAAFVIFVLSQEGRQILVDAGFSGP